MIKYYFAVPRFLLFFNLPFVIGVRISARPSSWVPAQKYTVLCAEDTSEAAAPSEPDFDAAVAGSEADDEKTPIDAIEVSLWYHADTTLVTRYVMYNFKKRVHRFYFCVV